MNAAERLDELRVSPGNRLEPLAGDRAGQKSLRINDQWRVCFRWKDGDAHDVEICRAHAPIHPGEILEEFLKPLGLSQYRVAKDISVPPRRPALELD